MGRLLVDLSQNIPKEPTFAQAETFGRGAVLGWSLLSETKLVQTSMLAFSDHVATHIDAPAHFLPGGKTIDEMPPELFLETPALWLDCSGKEPGEEIGAPELEEALQSAGEAVNPGDAVLIYTGCSKKWGMPDYRQSVRPVAPAAVNWLLGLGVMLFGVDGPEIDTDPIEWPAHKMLREHEFYIIENLALWPAVADLPRRFRMIAAPLSLREATAAPCRVVAIVERS
jgi:kynurenine formamidase